MRPRRMIATVVFLLLGTAVGAQEFQNKATDARNNWHYYVNHMTSEQKTDFDARIAQLEAEAPQLDADAEKLGKRKTAIDEATAALQAAQQKLKQKQDSYDSTMSSAESQLGSIRNQLASLCQQLGGSMGGDNICRRTFQCSSDNMGACQAQQRNWENSFNNQAEPLKNQVKQIVKDAQDAEAAKQDAQGDVDTAQKALDEAQADPDGLQASFDSRSASFNERYNKIKADLDAVDKTPLQLKTGPAFQQLNDIAVTLQQKGTSQPCFDGEPGCIRGHRSSLVVVPPEPAVNSPAFKQAYDDLHKQLDDANKKAEDARAALNAAEHDPNATPAELSQKVKDMAAADMVRIGATYKITVMENLLRQVPPKAAKP